MNKEQSIDWIIEQLGLEKHPEGGYFKEVYRSDERLSNLPERFSGKRSVATSIYFLLRGSDRSHFHRIKSDETWHFYLGTTLVLHEIDSNGNYSKVQIGNNLANGESLQYTVKRGVWFGAEVLHKDSYALLGCSVAPGFDFQDFELARYDELSATCPQQKDLIKQFCLS